jgi:ribose-phosphate pyrophosphokinase
MLELVYGPAKKVIVPVTVFPDKTSQVWKLDPSHLNTTFAQINWYFENEGELMQVAQLKDLLDSYGTEVRLTLKYLPYGRQDKEVSNVATFALHSFARIVNSLNFSEVVIVDPHSEIALNLINRSSATYPMGMLQNIMLNSKTTLVCYPDKGAVSKYTKVYDRLVGEAYIYGEKVRDQLTGNITSYSIVGPCAGEHVLIVDDICDGGATFKLLAKDLLAAGAKSVALFVTHGIFSRGVKTLLESGIAHVYTADGEVFGETN